MELLVAAHAEVLTNTAYEPASVALNEVADAPKTGLPASNH